MGKRLAPIIAVLAMLAPVAAFALGLGNITMKSALNQPLDAEIKLLSVQKGDLENLKIRLGSLEDFARVGADRAYFLTKIKFSLAKRPDGTPYVRLNSTELVTEPFLDFVVEARWPRGRILREYTVLVDPPVFSDEAPAPIRQAAVQTAPTAAVTSTRATRQAPIRERATLSPVMSRDGVLSYGPVQPNDTLWVIASRMRPDNSVSVNQMMLALVRDNPQAFYNGNVNQLKAGYVLRIEDPAAITAVSVAQANAEIEHQRAEWQARKSGRPMRQVAATEAPVTAAGTGAGEGSGAAGQARLKLVAPGSEGSGSGTGDADVDRLRQDLVLAAEALDANRQETEELKTRLSQMEEQLAAMQRLIMLKDDEMLSLQKQLGGEAEEPAVPEAVSEQEVLEGEAVEGAELAEGGAETLALEVAETEETQEPETPKPAVPAPVIEAPAPEPGLLESPLLMYGGIGVLVLAIVGWIVARRRKMQEGFQESILNVGGEGAAAGATSSEIAQGVGGESSMVSDFAMSEISDMSGIQTDASDVDPISEADVYLAYGRHQQAEDIIRAALESDPERNELKLKLLEVFFAAKNSEAFELQAQELHDALGDETDPLWAKAVTMGSQLCPGNPLFGDAVQALQGEAGGGAADADEDLLDFDFDLDTPDLGDTKVKAEAGGSGLDDSERRESTQAAPPATPDNSLDFDVSSLDFSLDQRADEVEDRSVAAADDNALDFDMTVLDEAVATPEAEAKVVSEDAREALGDLDQSTTDADNSIAEFSSDEMALSKQSEQTDGEISDFNVDLSAEELALGDDETLKFDSPAKEADSGEFDIVLDEEVAESDLLIVEEGVESIEAEQPDADKGKAVEDELTIGEDLEDELLGDDMFGEVDEIGTKLDLAKAYVDMGDGDGARSILDEVLEEGDDTQKQQAKDLLEQIG